MENETVDIIHRIIAAEQAGDRGMHRQLLEKPEAPEFLKMRHEVQGFRKSACTLDGTVDAAKEDPGDHLRPCSNERRPGQWRYRTADTQRIVLMARAAPRGEDVRSRRNGVARRLHGPLCPLGTPDPDRGIVVEQHDTAPDRECYRNPVDRQWDATVLLIGFETLIRFMGSLANAHLPSPLVA